MHYGKKLGLAAFIFSLALVGLLSLASGGIGSVLSSAQTKQVSDHFDGKLFFNPSVPQPSESSTAHQPSRGIFWYAWRWLVSDDRPAWPKIENFSLGPPPAPRVSRGAIRITPVGHATFLIQMDGLNILTDPIWSNRCSPVSWAGPSRHQPPGIRLPDLPSVDVVLISHNHYDHLDLPTLQHLAAKGKTRALVPLGNLELIRKAGIPDVAELDWWQSVPLSADVNLTLVPAQHFSSRTPWDRNETLWEALSSRDRREIFTIPEIPDTDRIFRKSPAVSRRSGLRFSRFRPSGRSNRMLSIPLNSPSSIWGLRRPFRHTLTCVENPFQTSTPFRWKAAP